jgi:hypothetical protein
MEGSSLNVEICHRQTVKPLLENCQADIYLLTITALLRTLLAPDQHSLLLPENDERDQTLGGDDNWKLLSVSKQQFDFLPCQYELRCERACKPSILADAHQPRPQNRRCAS